MNNNDFEWQEQYDPDADAELVASERGQICINPKPNQLQIDIDSEEQLEEFRRRLSYVEQFVNLRNVKQYPSKSFGKFHIYLDIEFLDKREPISNEERILLQAALNDDPFRVWMNTCRLLMNSKIPSRLFANPDSQEAKEQQ